MVERLYSTSPKSAEGKIPATHGSDGYFVHKISKQLVGGSIKTVGTVFRTFAEYQGFHIGYLENPNKDYFQEYWNRIHRSDNQLGRFFGRFLPNNYRKNNLTLEELKNLKQHSSEMSVRGALWAKAATGVMVAGNVGATFSCLSDNADCTASQYTTFAANSLTAGTYYVAVDYFKKGSEFQKKISWW